MSDGGAGRTYLFDDRQETLTKDEFDAIKTQSVCMAWDTYKWIRIAIEKMCAELKDRDTQEYCVKEELKQAFSRVEGSAKRFGRKNRR